MIENIWFYIDAQRSNILNKSSIQGQELILTETKSEKKKKATRIN